MFTVALNSEVVLETSNLTEACKRFNILLNQIVPPDTAKIEAHGAVIACVKPGSIFYNNQILQPDVQHWFRIQPTDAQKVSYYRCQEAIAVYADRCMQLLGKKTLLSSDLKSWLDAARNVLARELPPGNPYSLKAGAALSVYHLYTKPPEQRDIEKILTQTRLAFLYCHLALFSSAGPSTVYYLKPAR